MNILFEFYYVFITNTNKFIFLKFIYYIFLFTNNKTDNINIYLVLKGFDKIKMVLKLNFNKNYFNDYEIMLNYYFILFYLIQKFKKK